MKHICSITAICLLLAACEPSIKISSDYDKTADFGQYKTFALYRFVDNQGYISDLNKRRIADAVRNEMVNKGFALKDSSTADLLVNAVAIIAEKRDVTAYTNYYGYGGYYRPYAWGPGYGGAYGTTTYSVDEYKQGTLMIDIVDAKNHQLVWQGVGEGRVDDQKDNSKREERIKDAIGKIMASFPPGAKTGSKK